MLATVGIGTGTLLSETSSAQDEGLLGTLLPGRKLQVCRETWPSKSYIRLCKNGWQGGRLWQNWEVPSE